MHCLRKNDNWWSNYNVSVYSQLVIPLQASKETVDHAHSHKVTHKLWSLALVRFRLQDAYGLSKRCGGTREYCSNNRHRIGKQRRKAFLLAHIAWCCWTGGAISGQSKPRYEDLYNKGYVCDYLDNWDSKIVSPILDQIEDFINLSHWWL